MKTWGEMYADVIADNFLRRYVERKSREQSRKQILKRHYPNPEARHRCLDNFDKWCKENPI